MIYSLRDAAKQLGIHPQTLKRHKYTTGLFEKFGTLVGKSLAFSEADIAEMRKLLAKAPGHGNTSLSKAEVLKRQMKALEMSENNKSLQEIATKLGFKDTSGAYRAIQAAKKKRKEQ